MRSVGGQSVDRVAHNRTSRLPSRPILITTCRSGSGRERASGHTPTSPSPGGRPAHSTSTRALPGTPSRPSMHDHGAPQSPRRTSPGSRSRSRWPRQPSHQHMTLRSRICDSISLISSSSVHLHRVARTSSLSICLGPTGPSRSRPDLRVAGSPEVRRAHCGTSDRRTACGRTEDGLRSRSSTRIPWLARC
jgi:hypothetical protein